MGTLEITETMSGRSEADIRRQLQDEQKAMAELLVTGKKTEAVKNLVEASKIGMKGLLDLPYQGERVGNAAEYKDAKKLADELFRKVWKVYWGGAPFPLQKLARAHPAGKRGIIHPLPPRQHILFKLAPRLEPSEYRNPRSSRTSSWVLSQPGRGRNGVLASWTGSRTA